MTCGLSKNLKLGCPVWAHSAWTGNFFTSDARRSDYLRQYGSVFNAVEGNSSFYGLPSTATVERWCLEAPAEFEFCFKFPRVVSHDLMMNNAVQETMQFINRVRPLGEHLGPFFLQLPPQFGPRQLSNLVAFIESLPKEFNYCVEVRNRQFFEDPVTEEELNVALTQLGADRVIFDTRSLFAGQVVDEDT
jgi:uncharacterized protein YecE (DUF72 family)